MDTLTQFELLEALGNALQGEHNDGGPQVNPEQMLAWMAVCNAARTQSPNLQQCIERLDLDAFGSHIVFLAGSLRNEKVVELLGQRVQWHTLLSPLVDSNPTFCPQHDYRSALVERSTQSFWIWFYGRDRAQNTRDENVSFVYHTVQNCNDFSFNHKIPCAVFGKDIPFNTAVLTHNLGESYYIFSNVAFDTAPEDEADFAVAACVYFISHAHDPQWEEYTLLSSRREQELLERVKSIDMNQMYDPSPHWRATFGWNSPVPLGAVCLAVLNSRKYSRDLVQQANAMVFSQLTSAGARDSFGPLCAAFAQQSIDETYLWVQRANTLKMFQHVDNIANQWEQTLLEQSSVSPNPTVLRNRHHVVQALTQGIETPYVQHHNVAALLHKWTELFYRTNNSNTEWTWTMRHHLTFWWDADKGFDQSIGVFPTDARDKILQHMTGVREAMYDLANLHSYPPEPHQRARLVLQTFDAHQWDASIHPKKLKL